MTCTLDFPHAAAWCPACYAESQTNAIIAEAKRANDLKAELSTEKAVNRGLEMMALHYGNQMKRLSVALEAREASR